jgi:hypothetical protein
MRILLHRLGGATIVALSLLSVAFVAADAQSQDRPFQFALIGDMPYTKVQEREYQSLLKVLNAADLAFVAHIGDFQFDSRPYNQDPSRASMPCVEENYKAIYDSFQSVRHPFVLTPGDNDWTDCWPLKARKVDPLQLLAGIRTRFFPEGRSLGQRTIAVKNQSADPRFAKFRENLRWQMGGVTFVTLHIVGSNDNFGRTPEMDAEHLETFDRPVAYLHGDTHLFRIDKPLYSAKTGRLFENFTRVETFGWPDTHWERVIVDASHPALFKFSAEIVPDNIVNRRTK